MLDKFEIKQTVEGEEECHHVTQNCPWQMLGDLFWIMDCPAVSEYICNSIQYSIWSFSLLPQCHEHGRTQPKALLGVGGQSEVQKGTLLMMIWHQKKGTCSQKGHFIFQDYRGEGAAAPLPPP